LRAFHSTVYLTYIEEILTNIFIPLYSKFRRDKKYKIVKSLVQNKGKSWDFHLWRMLLIEFEFRLVTPHANNRDMLLYRKLRLWGCYYSRYVTNRDVLVLATIRYFKKIQETKTSFIDRFTESSFYV
jgi:hypothetical protein